MGSCIYISSNGVEWEWEWEVLKATTATTTTTDIKLHVPRKKKNRYNFDCVTARPIRARKEGRQHVTGDG